MANYLYQNRVVWETEVAFELETVLGPASSKGTPSAASPELEEESPLGRTFSIEVDVEESRKPGVSGGAVALLPHHKFVKRVLVVHGLTLTRGAIAIFSEKLLRFCT